MSSSRALAVSVVLLSLLGTRESWACACCDGESEIAPLGWSKQGRELLLRHQEVRGCERRVKVAVFPIDAKAPSACYDLLGDPDRRVPCAKVTADWEKKPAAAFKGVTEAVVGIPASDFSARYVVQMDGAFRKTAIEVFLKDGETPLVSLPAYEYEYTSPGGDGETELFPLEVTILPALDQPARAAVFARGLDDDPGIGHRGFVVRWAELPPATNRAPGVAWVRALPRFKSPKPDVPPNAATRANGAGVRALEAGRLLEARSHFEAAVAFDPAHALGRYNLACTLARQGAPALALRQLVELLTEAPEPTRTERRERARVDPDLESLRGLPKFQELVCGGLCAPLPVSSTGVSAAPGTSANDPKVAPTANGLPVAAGSSGVSSSVSNAPSPPGREESQPSGSSSCALEAQQATAAPLGWLIALAGAAGALRRKSRSRPS